MGRVLRAHQVDAAAVAQELGDLDQARIDVAAIVAARVPPGGHQSRNWRLIPNRVRLMWWCTWLGFSKADTAAADFRAPIRVAADLAHAIRRQAPSSPGALGIAVAVLESCGYALDDTSLGLLCAFAQQCRFPKRVS
jgi:hypothetical protein